MVWPNSCPVSRVGQYLGTAPVLAHDFRLRDFHPLWSSFPGCSTIHALCNRTTSLQRSPAPPLQPPLKNACRLNFNGFGLFPFRSPLLGEYLRFLFLEVLRCFTSLGIASAPYEFKCGSHSMTRAGLPHSEISGSKPVCGSPKHIAAYHVLHRLLPPSHPPQTLRSLTLMSDSRVL